VQVVGVAWLGSQGAMQAFEDRHGLTFPSLDDQTGELFARFGVPGQPAWVFVSPDGSVDRVVGAVREDALVARFEELASST
jgi:peroxiredoxin